MRKPKKLKPLPHVEKVAYTAPEAMYALGLGRTRFYEEVKLGRLKLLKSGRRTLVPVSAVKEFLARLSAEAA